MFKTIEDKNRYEKIIFVVKEIKKGLDIDFNKQLNFNLPTIELTQDLSDLDTLSNRLLILSRTIYYLSVLQGSSLELQKEYKSPKTYSLYETIVELNKAVKIETDILRSILSTARSQITLK